MILHYVTDYAKTVKISTTSFSTKWFFESDLHLCNVVSVPSSVQYSVSKSEKFIPLPTFTYASGQIFIYVSLPFTLPESHEILNHLFAQVMINTVHLIFTE